MQISYQVFHGNLYKAIDEKVEAYFVANNLEKTGNSKLHWFSILVFISLLISYFSWLFLGNNVWLNLIFSVLTGFLIGVLGAITHEATHRAFGNKAWQNKLMLFFSDFIGKSSDKYGQAHAFHHTFTNIDHQDPDIGLEPFLRLSPKQPKKPWHKFQHLYAWLVYCTAAFYTVFSFHTFNKYFSGHPLKAKIGYWLGKISHIVFLIFIPILFLGFQSAILGYIALMVVAGLYISLIIQPSHLFIGSEFISANSENKIPEEWTEHMIKVTSNYANGNKLLSLMYAGMDYHIVHQVYPHISMVHFPQINSIIREVAIEQGLEYKEFPNLIVALQNHYQHLKKLGKK